MNSEIVQFFHGKNIFLTGATGFVGKLLIDQLLRKCEPNKLYLLIRSKKGVEPKQRLEKLFEEVIYERLKNEKPNFIEKILIINGELTEDNLGLNEEDQLNLIENVNIVIHGGATVKFDEPLKQVTKTNVKGTLSVIKLCHKIKKLNAFIHISTAYSNCHYHVIKEEFYDSPIESETLVKIAEKISDEELQILQPKILGNRLNTYIFSKAVAEDAIKNYTQGLPVSIVRPAMIVNTKEDPITGWVDNLYGPIGLTTAVAYGVLRVMKFHSDQRTDVVPGDMVASSILAATYKTSQKKEGRATNDAIVQDNKMSRAGPARSDNKIVIYNYVPNKENPAIWGPLFKVMKDVGEMAPLDNAVWASSFIVQPNHFLYTILSFLLHFLPAFLIDVGLFLVNKKTFVLKLYRKGNKLLNIVHNFTMTEWDFSNDNVRILWEELNDVDKQLFNFNMGCINWEKMLREITFQGRLYIAKETPDSIPRALKKLKRRRLIQNVILICLAGWIITFLLQYIKNKFFMAS